MKHTMKLIVSRKNKVSKVSHKYNQPDAATLDQPMLWVLGIVEICWKTIIIFAVPLGDNTETKMDWKKLNINI